MNKIFKKLIAFVSTIGVVCAGSMMMVSAAEPAGQTSKQQPAWMSWVMIIGYILFGQLKADTDFTSFEKYIVDLGLDIEEMKNYYNGISFFDSGKIQSVSNIASMLVKHILLENMLKPAFDENIQKAVSFIHENLENDLSIHTISQSIHVSKSVLYKKFHACFHCTVSEYINSKRVEKSIEWLTKTDLSIEEIAQKVGFSSTSYFTKTFKRLKGITPLKYKKTL